MKCGSSQIEIVGVKGVGGKNLAKIVGGSLGGAVGSAIVGAAQGDFSKEKPQMPLSTIQYKCDGCGEKFEAEPHGTEENEVLEAPFSITFTRKAPFGDDPYNLYLNGVLVSVIPYLTNIFRFQTSVRHNTLFLIGALGKTVKNGVYRFEAQPGGSISLLYTKKQFTVE